MHDQHSRGSDRDLIETSLVGSSPAMRRLKELIPRIARSRSNVLIQGESGTGKELVARAIHKISPRGIAPFIAENCAALPDGVVESELFGHVRGAFTGAERDRIGLIALADGGTLFLDEVGDLGPRTQAKLLRVIQEGEYRPVGGRTVHRSNFRVLSATHRDLSVMAARGEFREDLFYRLNVIHVRVPPLRERVEDIPELIEHTLKRLAAEAAKEAKGSSPSIGGPRERVESESAGLSREALDMLLRYPWPGNVRELQNVIEAGLVMATEGILGVAELPDRILDYALSEPAAAGGASAPAEKVMVETALARFAGDKAKAARFVGWSRQKLYRVMARYRIPQNFGRGSAPM